MPLNIVAEKLQLNLVSSITPSHNNRQKITINAQKNENVIGTGMH